MPDGDLQAAVFRVMYQSRQQRLARVTASAILLIKHALRGLFFSWPLYLLALVPLVIEGVSVWWAGLFLLPAILVSGYILNIGVREDYREKVDHKILSRRDLRQLFF